MQSIIENTWKEEYDAWHKELQIRRKEDYEKTSKTNGPFDPELYYRNWGNINYCFADNFFQILEELKITNTKIYEKYCEKANEIIEFWGFESDTVLESKFTLNKHK